jgi:hypothetical protein
VREIAYFVACTVDGYIAARDGSIDAFVNDEGYFGELFESFPETCPGRFRPSAPFDERLLRGLPEVSGVSRRREEVLVTGSGDLLQAVTTVLARRGVSAADLEHERATLEDAYVALTGRKAEERVS